MPAHGETNLAAALRARPATKRGAKSRPGKAKDPRDTPAMRQFARFKSEHPDCVLFFRVGDFYETFDDDAVLAHKALGITLTQRTEGVPMAGVPYHALEGYLRRMVDQGYRVAVCDQIQDPSEAKGVVDRAVTRVLTPGTLVDEALLEDAVSNIVAAVHLEETGDEPRAWLAAVELSTGRFTLLELPAARLADELARLGPSELLFAETSDGNEPPRLAESRRGLSCPATPRPDWTFRQSDARDLLTDHFGVRQLEGYGFAADDPAIAAAGALLAFLRQTQSPDDASGGRLKHLQPPRRQTSADFLTVDATTLRGLEIERTIRSGQVDGSLLGVLQRCVTAMGKRLLRQWLCFPLRDRARIETRQNAVATLVEDGELLDDLRGELAGVADVARIVGRLGLRRATPRDVVALGASLDAIDHLLVLIADRPDFARHRELLRELATVLQPIGKTIRESCVQEPPAHLREGGLFRDGRDAELDEARSLQRDASAWLARYQKQLVDETGIGSLKVGFNKVFGYYIEITHAHAARVPDSFTRTQTLKNAERYATPELRTFQEKVTTASSRAVEREKTLFESLCSELSAAGRSLTAFAELIAGLDVVGCFAEVARRYGYVRPELVDEPELRIEQGRHPVLDGVLRDGFVPNDCRLACADEPASMAIITGPNMAGKSTYIRQVALIVLMAHTGCFVPAEAATIGMTDRIFTRIGASDELHAGQSTFMVEMVETASILHHCTGRSLVILDEIGRGTSTLDGLALAWAIAETIASRGCRALFATHYHELTNLADRLESVTNLHVSVREWGEEVIFLYRILPGRTDRSYGIHVARIAGLPPDTIARATALLENLAVEHSEARLTTAAGPVQTPQMNLFAAPPDPTIEELRALDLERMTPLEAFDTLRALRSRLSE